MEIETMTTTNQDKLACLIRLYHRKLLQIERLSKPVNWLQYLALSAEAEALDTAIKSRRYGSM
ncbi:MAG: hypothetical protein CSB48_10885 [Proteobacteria bacterium]|nr:MAG: hypothetical protein CSB48_10885 [Pseudomonadota bacterium]PIE40047.1 MAG: hypothetical protein CSA51_02650 [Gammaproteobacteria bacterium]